MRTYTATVTRDGQWWAIRVPELQGVFSQAKRLDQCEGEIRDSIAGYLGAETDSFGVTIDVDDKTTATELAALEVANASAEKAALAAAAERQRVIRALSERGLSYRDIGHLLGVSHQRIAQLLEGAA